MSNITIPGFNSGEPPTEPMPTAAAVPPPLTGFAAGFTGAALLVVGVWALHLLSHSAEGSLSVGSVVLLLMAFTALGKGINLLQRALAPIIAIVSASVSEMPAPLRALTAIVVGAAGIWWIMRGHAAMWWAQTTGTTEGWSLTSALVQVALIALAGALLFGGAKSAVALLIAAFGARPLAAAKADRLVRDRWVTWWSSRPGLGLMLLAGGAALVTLSGYIVPHLSGWLTADDQRAALIAIVVILVVGLLANTWWWGALAGWWTWAHRPHSPGGGATPIGQIHAGAAVVALLWFSATAFGLAAPDSYTGPGAMPRARADCPPDCGGSGGSGSFGPNPSQFQPPQMPEPPGQYQGGSGYPGLDQNNGVSLYNPATGQSGPAQGGYSQYPAQGQPGPPANGVQPPNYDAPPQPQAPAPQQGAASPQQGPPPPQQAPAQQTAQAPQEHVPATQGPQQASQQPAGQPQGQLQPGQANQPPQQGQPGQPNQPAQQGQQQPQNQKPTTPKKEPNTPIDPTDLAAAATRRGSQTAGQQATQAAGQQASHATQQSTQQATQATQQSTQRATQTAKQPAQATQQNTTPKPNQRTGFDEWANGEQGANESRRKTLDQMGNLLGSSGDGLSDAVKEAEAGSDLNRLAKGAKILKGIGPVGDIAGGVMDAVSGAKTPGDALGNTVSGMVGGAIGGALGSALGPLGTAAGSYLGNKIGQGLWDHRQGIIDAVKDPADAASKIGGQISGAVSALADNTASALGDGLKAVGNFLW
ncbi:hypothetical protein [Mycolicibacterium mucogenicum]|uniref:hypothetical protein n=1 Tax=Mycolicibacterium mucogenicum TaxID=56689 RepID=UPI000AEA0154|nr:hypothetical protein [Mycolicibacterium mucogenicum]